MAFDLDNEELKATRKMRGLDDGVYEDKMSEADKMFKELGYEDLSDETNFGRIKLYEKYDKRIGFYNDRTFTVYNYLDGLEYLDMQELKAINKKCEELGWI